MKTKRYTKRCSDGRACTGSGSGAAFIPDEVDTCDSCLLDSHGLLGQERYDGCDDPWSMDPLYRRETVVTALRKAEG